MANKKPFSSYDMNYEIVPSSSGNTVVQVTLSAHGAEEPWTASRFLLGVGKRLCTQSGIGTLDTWDTKCLFIEPNRTFDVKMIYSFRNTASKTNMEDIMYSVYQMIEYPEKHMAA